MRGWVVVVGGSPSIRIEVQVEHSDVDGILNAPGGIYMIIFSVEDLYTLDGDLVALPRIKVQVLQYHRCSWASVFSILHPLAHPHS